MSPGPDPAADPETAPDTARPPRPEPALTKPDRGALTLRDMLVAIGVLLVVVLAIGGLTRGFTFAPAGPTVDPTGVHTVDAPTELRALAPTVPFPLRVPALPAGWRATSVAREPLSGTDRTSVRVGLLTTRGQYLMLVQSDAAEEALVAARSGAHPLIAQGAQDVAGQRWVVYGARPDEPVWIADVATPGAASVRLLISGSAEDDDYRVLAAAARSATPLPRP